MGALKLRARVTVEEYLHRERLGQERQEAQRIEHFTRQKDGAGSCQLHLGPDAVVHIDSISCSLKLADVCNRVRLHPENDAD